MTTKVCVFVASHIRYDGQLDYLSKCLSSLVNQTVVPDIYVSISFSGESYKKDFADKIIPSFKSVNFLPSESRMYQMEHIYKLTTLYADKYGLIMFCDDDDTYELCRVEKFIECYNMITSPFKIGGVKEIFESKNPSRETPEFWLYGIISSILIEFFHRFEIHNQMKLLKHNFGDMFLRLYLRHIYLGDETFKYGGICNNKLYNYNEHPDSICGNIEKISVKMISIMENQLVYKKYISDNPDEYRATCEQDLFLGIICRPNNEKLNEIIEQSSRLVSKKYTKYLIKIYEFCTDILYI